MSTDELQSESIQEYLEVIYKLSQNADKVKNSEIAKKMNIAPASVTQMMQRLSELGYVNYYPYKGVNLTVEGRRIAKKMVRRHRLLECFLHYILKIKKDRVHDQACEIEHTLNDESERALCQLLKHPDKCPDTRNPIPACDLKLSSCDECMKKKRRDLGEIGKRDQDVISLADPALKEGQKARIAFIRGGHKMIRRLLDLGITVGATIVVLRKAPFRGPVEIAVRGSNIALGRTVGSSVFVEVLGV